MSILDTAARVVGESSTVESRLRSEVGEVVRAYRHSWDIYSELIQNSIDAINRRFRILNDPDFYLYNEYHSSNYEIESDPGYRGRLKLEIDLSLGTIQIFDNGTGILSHRIEEFLLPKGGDKTVNHEYGFKGYGLTFAAFISDEFHLVSRHFAVPNSDAYGIQLNGLFQWLYDDSGTTRFPTTPFPDTSPSDYDLDDWSTMIKIKMAGNYSVL